MPTISLKCSSSLAFKPGGKHKSLTLQFAQLIFGNCAFFSAAL
jgi:hypothetical protein